MRNEGAICPVGFQDAEFPHRFAWCRSPLEGGSLRWVPYGMPRLNTRFKHMAFFLYGRSPKTGRIVGPLGTGFFVGIEAKGHWLLRHYYAITCYHVAVKVGASIIRINTGDGGSRFIEFEPHEWQFIPGGDDICAVDITDRIRDQDEYSVIHPSWVTWKDFIIEEEVDVGEDGFMLGLFADHPGKKQNLIAARFGNLSLLAQRDEPIEQPNGHKRPSHIFDMRSRPGFSGSPVFIYRTPAGDLRTASDRGRSQAMARALRQRQPSDRNRWGESSLLEDMETEKNTFLMLLGVHTGQYSERVEARKIKKISGESDDIVRDRDKLKIPSSMAVVAPAWEIINLLNRPIFVAQREERDMRMDAKRDEKNVPEPESVVPVEKPASADDANPNHLADFTRLVDVAARKRPQGD
jgi:hypothetical protein